MKNSVMIIAAVAVAVVVVAAAGIVLLNNKDDSSYRSADTSGRLMIMGNANNDDYLDDEDVSTLEKFIKDNKADWKDTNPLADANNDGNLTQEDVDMVKKMVNRESMSIYFAYIDDSNALVVKSISYPIKNIMIVGDDVVIALQGINATSKCKGVAVSDFDNPINACIKDYTHIGTKSTAADVSLASNAADKDTVLITSAASRYLTNEDAFVNAGIPVVRMNVGSTTCNAGFLTVGYLLGLEEAANKIVKFSDDITSNIASKVKDLEKRSKVIVANRTKNISGKSSEYYAIAEKAGAENMIDYNQSHTSFDKSKDDWLYAIQLDYILHFTSLGYGEVDADSQFTTYATNFTDTDAYKAGHYYLLNANMPMCVCVAFAASLIYSDIFGTDYGYDCLSEYVKDYTCLPDTYDVKSGSYLFCKGSTAN